MVAQQPWRGVAVQHTQCVLVQAAALLHFWTVVVVALVLPLGWHRAVAAHVVHELEARTLGDGVIDELP